MEQTPVIDDLSKPIPAIGRLWASPMTGTVLWSANVIVEIQDDGTPFYYLVGDPGYVDVTAMFEECARRLEWTPPA